MKGELKFLCRFKVRRDASGVYYSGILGNSRLLLFPEDGDLRLYLGGQVEVEKKSLQDDRRGANSCRVDLEAVTK